VSPILKLTTTTTLAFTIGHGRYKSIQEKIGRKILTWRSFIFI